MALLNKTCVPCQQIERAFTPQEVLVHLPQIPGWVIAENGKAIERSLVLKNFVACVEGIEKIKAIAEDQQHHPDVHLTGYKHLKVVLYTHTLGGVTENDLIVAAKINQVL